MVSVCAKQRTEEAQVIVCNILQNIFNTGGNESLHVQKVASLNPKLMYPINTKRIITELFISRTVTLQITTREVWNPQKFKMDNGLLFLED